MAITMYRACFDQIKAYEVEKRTELSVWIDGRRRAIESAGDSYHDTWEAAQQRLIRECEQEVAGARRRLERANSKLGNVKGLKPPKE